MKNNVYPCKPQFYNTKVGFKGLKIKKVCFRDCLCLLCYVIMSKTRQGKLFILNSYKIISVFYETIYNEKILNNKLMLTFSTIWANPTDNK